MAYDEILAHRIRELLAGQVELREKKMFGGVAFLVDGHMAITASGQGGVMVRVDPARSEALITSTGARPAVMRGREMRGWLRIDADDLRTKRQLDKWVTLGVSCARALAATG